MMKHIVNLLILYCVLAFIALNPDMMLAVYNEVNEFLAGCFRLVISMFE